MALYLISYDAHRERHYDRLYDLMASWSAARLHKSLWLAELRGPAETVRDIVAGTLDADDSVAVVELVTLSEWATIRAEQAGVEWLKRHLPFRD